jgi:hypothetical protein
MEVVAAETETICRARIPIPMVCITMEPMGLITMVPIIMAQAMAITSVTKYFAKW